MYTTKSREPKRVWNCTEADTLILNNTGYLTMHVDSAEYWKHFIARFHGVHAFGYNSTESKPIWMKSGPHCSRPVLADFRRDPRSSDSGKARQNFLSGKQRTTLPISGRPNFTKFRNRILKISPYGVVFKKR